jgi:hypothetical protein
LDWAEVCLGALWLSVDQGKDNTLGYTCGIGRIKFMEDIPMSRDNLEYCLSLCLLLLVMALIWIALTIHFNYYKKMVCERYHNVYECELIAVPVER